MPLKPDELKLVTKLGECFGDFCKLRRAVNEELLPGCSWMTPHQSRECAQNDMNEIAAKIHDLQHAVMAFSAQRDHPGAFRP